MGKPKLVSEVKIELLERYFAGESQSKLAMEFGVSVHTALEYASINGRYTYSLYYLAYSKGNVTRQLPSVCIPEVTKFPYKA